MAAFLTFVGSPLGTLIRLQAGNAVSFPKYLWSLFSHGKGDLVYPRLQKGDRVEPSHKKERTRLYHGNERKILTELRGNKVDKKASSRSNFSSLLHTYHGVT